ncbi:MAG: CGNR zinc finger domain-containing protein [Solirubrobacteraceae bacterium]|nr:CGNR zinc finger domain-containing protein [Solirubrobacteraceae bacterium]
MTQTYASTNGDVGTLGGLGLDRDFRNTGRLSIDLALTGGEGPEFAPLERIPSRAELNMWFAWSQLAVNAHLATEQDHLDARRLRWATWHAIEAVLTDTIPHERDRAVIDELASRPPLVPQLFGAVWAHPTIAQGLSTVARDAIDLLRDPFLTSRLRRCAADDCGVPFVDVSRPGQRRWCEDARCGDRFRQRRARQRRREAAAMA